MNLREFAIRVVERLQQSGYETYWAGGCVRDELLGKPPLDYDVATAAKPEEVQALFRRTHSFGASFGVVEVLGPRVAQGHWLKVQVATFRTDGHYTDGRRPDQVRFSTARDDAERRDFTMNALFQDPLRGNILDYVGGRADLEQKIVRAVGNPEFRFQEDKLRMLRAVRMAARFDFKIEPLTLAAIQHFAPELLAVSWERIAEEWRKILAHPRRVRGVELGQAVGLWQVVFPEVPWNPAVLTRLSRLPDTVDFPTAFAAALWDWPPRARATALERLKLSNAEIAKLNWLWQHTPTRASDWPSRPSELFPQLAHPEIQDLLALANVVDPSEDMQEAVAGLRARLLAPPPGGFEPPPLLTGDDLKQAGFRPGPQFRVWLEQVRAAQLNGELHDRAEALDYVRRCGASPSAP